jgi:hypothetical protein
MAGDPHSVTDILDKLDELAGRERQVKLGDVVEAMGNRKVAALICILLACTVPPLELLPFATTAPMAAIAAFGLALMVRDGVLMLVAMALSIVAVGVGLGLATGSGGK